MTDTIDLVDNNLQSTLNEISRKILKRKDDAILKFIKQHSPACKDAVTEIDYFHGLAKDFLTVKCFDFIDLERSYYVIFTMGVPCDTPRDLEGESVHILKIMEPEWNIEDEGDGLFEVKLINDQTFNATLDELITDYQSNLENKIEE